MNMPLSPDRRISSILKPFRRLGRAVATLRRDVSGVTAIEFAMIAPIFFGLLLMTIEGGIVFGAGQMLDSAIYLSSRQILTGSLQSAQNGGSSAATVYCTFMQSVCTKMTGVMSLTACYANLQIDMKDYPSSSTTGIPATDLVIPVTNTGALNTTSMNRLNLGNPGDYMLIRGYYPYPVYVNLFGGGTGTSNAGHLLLVGTAAVKLEPYSGSGASSGSSVTSTVCQ
jgi:Flp pilus assembly protein TadG